MDIEHLDRFPLNGTFELTARCNLSCKMCLIRIDNKRMAELGGRERTAEEWIHMAQEVQEAGTIGLLLTGGEPMLRPDFIQIYRAIAQMGFMLTLYTNATLVTEEIMEVLREFPPHRIGITVYGSSPETYEKVTGNANAYNRMLEGVERLRQLPSKLSIRTTIIKDNRKDLDEITRWAHNLGSDVEFGLSRIVTKPVRGGVADVDSCRLSPEENVAIIEQRNIDLYIKPLYKFIKKNPNVNSDESNKIISENKDVINNQSLTSNNRNKKTLYGCDSGMFSYSITWDGKLIGCEMLGDCCTHPFISSFQSAWDQFPTQVYIPPLPIQCTKCNISCCACPATRLSETGSLNGLPDYICSESKLSQDSEEKLLTIIKNMKGSIVDAKI
jgi:MoaA/NifB/PqqE/SkfB family radical SAM enzyme